MNVTVDNVEVLRLGRRYKYKLQTKTFYSIPVGRSMSRTVVKAAASATSTAASGTSTAANAARISAHLASLRVELSSLRCDCSDTFAAGPWQRWIDVSVEHERQRILRHAKTWPTEWLPECRTTLNRPAFASGRISPFDYFEMEYSCANESRLPYGALGDGPKWGDSSGSNTCPEYPQHTIVSP